MVGSWVGTSLIYKPITYYSIGQNLIDLCSEVIAADEMGMGKTATVLSLVCFTKEFAETLKLSYNPSKSKNREFCTFSV